MGVCKFLFVVKKLKASVVLIGCANNVVKRKY